jgi:hypothetical protein
MIARLFTALIAAVRAGLGDVAVVVRAQDRRVPPPSKQDLARSQVPELTERMQSADGDAAEVASRRSSKLLAAGLTFVQEKKMQRGSTRPASC